MASAGAPLAVRLVYGEPQDVPLGGNIGSVLVVDPAVLEAVAAGQSTLRITALGYGETIVIVTTPRGRVTLMIEVVDRPRAPTAEREAEAAAIAKSPVSGSYSLAYRPTLTGTHSVLQQRFDYSRKLGEGRTLRFSGDTVKYFDRAAGAAAPSNAPGFGINRISLGVTSAGGTVNILDSTLSLSPVSLSSYTMRGFHFVASEQSSRAGLDVFAGIARPSLSFAGGGQGRIFGALVPVAKGDDWRVRAGMIRVSPSKENQAALRTGGTIFQGDLLFTPSESTRFFGELEYSRGGLSGGAELEMRRTAFDLSAGFSHLDAGSPLISIGAQGAGRTLVTGAFVWRATPWLTTSANYSRSVQTAEAPSELQQEESGQGAPRETAALASETFQAAATARLSAATQLGLRFRNQRLDVLSSDPSSKPFRLDTREYAISYGARFGEHWTNQLDISATSTRQAGEGVERGFDIRDTLRRNWAQGAVSAFFRYSSNTKSIVSLLVRNPALLPPELRAEYEADPARFLAANGALLAGLFPGVALPYRRNTELGGELRGTISRFGFSSRTSFALRGDGPGSGGGLTESLNVSLNLDQANAIQVSAAHTFATGGGPSVSAIAVSYTHRFGAASGHGFQFGSLLGLDRSHIRGRVFMDMNSNGIDDPGEPGVASVEVIIDDASPTTTGSDGGFEFTFSGPSTRTISLGADALGTRYRASNATERRISVGARKTVEIGFGVNDFGSVAGRVYNDLFRAGASGTPLDNPGLSGVGVLLRRADKGDEEVGNHVTDASGSYFFGNLPPGSYAVEIDPSTVPLDFRVPAETSWTVIVAPLQAVYVDVPLVAERAIMGTVFVDKNGNGVFEQGTDEPVGGARITVGAQTATSTPDGRYLLRSLLAGRFLVSTSVPWAGNTKEVFVQLGPEPTIRRSVDVYVDPASGPR